MGPGGGQDDSGGGRDDSGMMMPIVCGGDIRPSTISPIMKLKQVSVTIVIPSRGIVGAWKHLEQVQAASNISAPQWR